MEVWTGNRNFFVDSVVGLKPLDDCPMVGMNFPEIPFFGFLEGLKTISDWKLDLIRVLNISIRVPQGELEG